MHDYSELFGMEGPLATAIPGFATREEQIAMAEQVALALRSLLGREAPILVPVECAVPVQILEALAVQLQHRRLDGQDEQQRVHMP